MVGDNNSGLSPANHLLGFSSGQLSVFSSLANPFHFDLTGFSFSGVINWPANREYLVFHFEFGRQNGLSKWLPAAAQNLHLYLFTSTLLLSFFLFLNTWSSNIFPQPLPGNHSMALAVADWNKKAKEDSLIRQPVSPETAVISEGMTRKTELVHENIILHSSLEPIRQLAVAQKKLFMAGFGAKWCMPCRLMEESTFKNAELLFYLEANYILKKIDIDDFDGFNVKQHYKVTLLPTFIIFDTGGNVIGRYEESLSASRMLSILKKHRKANPSRATHQRKKSTLEPVTTHFKPRQETKTIAGVKIHSVQLLRRPEGKPVRQVKRNGKNWNYTRVQFQLTSSQLALLTGKELVVKILETDTRKILSQLTLRNYSRNNSIQIMHPGYKVLAKNYVIQVFYRNRDGSLSLLSNGSKPIITDYSPLE